MSKYISPWHLSAVMLNLRADALTAAYSGDYQRGRPTTGIKAAHCLSPTGATAVQLTQPAPTDISEMEQAALHRMAKSIAQLTLYQVTGEEIETATKLLEKACQKLRGIPEVPPQRITDLDNATRQLHLRKATQPSKPTWVSVQDDVLNKLDRPRNQVNRSQSSATFTTHLLRNILSNYCCGVHRACTNNPLKSDRRKLDDKAGKPV